MQRRPLLFLMMALALVFVASYTSRLAEYRRLQTDTVSLQTQIVDAEARGRELAAGLDHVKSNEYVEEVAITELDMAKEGVTVLTILDEPAGAQAAASVPGETATDDGAVEEAMPERAAREAGAEVSGWRAWLSLFSRE